MRVCGIVLRTISQWVPKLTNIWYNEFENFVWNEPQINAKDITGSGQGAWCWQATSHYQNQQWQRPMMLNGITKPQCVKRQPKSFTKWILDSKSVFIESHHFCGTGQVKIPYTSNQYGCVLCEPHGISLWNAAWKPHYTIKPLMG